MVARFGDLFERYEKAEIGNVATVSAQEMVCPATN